jgi:kynurenine 3-monooxygenase
MPNKTPSTIDVIGAGLVGSLLSIYLAKRGHRVRVLERRLDMRVQTLSAGRSINLALSTRGIHALSRVGLDQKVLEQSIPMFGRTLHMRDGSEQFFAYGKTGTECIYSTSRGALNKLLMSEAELSGQVAIEFESKVESVDLDKSTLTLGDGGVRQFETLIGTDGSASALRQSMQKIGSLRSTESTLDYGYKELTLHPGAGGSFQLSKNSLHIWPRETFMVIALPNPDGSFTCTLFLSWKGRESFETLQTPEQVRSFFAREFSDLSAMLPHLESEFFENPTGHMVTVKSEPWNYRERALLLGDAAHAIVPFFGQGMNCGFEDVSVLDDMFSESSSLEEVFSKTAFSRKPNADAIADLALENFVEMRDRVTDPQFQLERKVEKILEREHPGKYISRYALVTFSRVPYRLALDAGVIEQEILSELCRNLSDPEQFDRQRARTLIDSKLAPLLGLP